MSRYIKGAKSLFTDDEEEESIYDGSRPSTPPGLHHQSDLAPSLSFQDSDVDDDNAPYFSDIKDRPPRYRAVNKHSENDESPFGVHRTYKSTVRKCYSSDDSLSTASASRGTTRQRVAQGQHRNKQPSSSKDTGSQKEVARSGDSSAAENVTDIYAELQKINEKMKREFKILHERDQVLKERERVLTEAESAVAAAKASLEMTIELEVKRRVMANEEQHRAEIERVDQVLKEKSKENKRLKDNFDTLKVANDTLRRELENMESVHGKMEKQATSLQARLTNLQRKAEHDQRKDNDKDFLPPELLRAKKQKEVQKGKNQPVRVHSGSYDLLHLQTYHLPLPASHYSKMFKNHFGWADYVVLAAILVLCVILGIIPACTGGKQSTPSEYLMANKKLTLLPVTISLSVSYVSGIAMMGMPAEAYFFGIHTILWSVGTGLGALVAAFTFVPVMYETQTSSVNRYLLIRFSSKTVKYTGLVLHLMLCLLINALVIIGPAMFMQTVSDLPVWASIILMGSISTFYTALGGIKAVIWTDALQAIIIYTGILIVLIQGTIGTGSVSRTWELYTESGLSKFDFIPSPLKRSDFWTMILLQWPIWYSNYGTNQLAVQRYTSMPTLKMAQRCMLLQMPCSVLFYTSSILMGIVAYGYYANLECDPYTAGYIQGVNQIIPYMVMDVMTLPGLPGLFFSGIFAGALSNLSSMTVAAAYMVWEDVLKARYKSIKEKHKTCIIKVLVIASGALSTGASFILIEVGGTLVQMTYSLMTTIIVPMAIMFTLAAAWPRANSKTALVSSLLPAILILWIATGAIYHKTPPQPMPMTTTGCYSGNATSGNDTLLVMTTRSMLASNNVTEQSYEGTSLETMYKISHMWYFAIGVTIGIILGVTLSFIPGFHNKEKIDERYIFPCLRHIFRKHLIQKSLVPTEDKDLFETNF